MTEQYYRSTDLRHRHVCPSVTCQFVTCARTLKHMTKLFSLLDGPNQMGLILTSPISLHAEYYLIDCVVKYRLSVKNSRFSTIK